MVQAVGSDDDDHNDDTSLFHSWLQRHDKSYENEQEFNHRLNVFLFNSKLVEKHNLAFEMGYTTYKMTMNNLFSDLTDEEFSRTHLMESQNCSATTSTTSTSRSYTSDILNNNKKNELPKSVDWRKYTTPIKNQKHCGSCWTFSTTGTLEAHTCMNNPDLDCSSWTGLAEQQLLDCAGNFDNHGCNGGLPSHAFEYIKYAGGLDTEESYPYHASHDGPCLVSTKTFGAHVAEIYNITSGDEDDLINAIGNVGPVSVAYDVSPDFRFYSHGVYDSYNATTNQTNCKNNSMSVNHAVVAVGYGETEETPDSPSIPFYIIRNSWSTSWGMEGYFWIKRGENLCGISDCASFPIVPFATTTVAAAVANANAKNSIVVGMDNEDEDDIKTTSRLLRKRG